MKKTYLYFIIVFLFIPCIAQEDLPLARYKDLRFNRGLAYKDGQLFTGILLDTLLINNRPITIGQFKEGKKNSLFVERYSPVKKKYEGLFVEGKKEGAHFEWYENGNIKSEANYSEDEMNGKVSCWYEDGKKQIEATYLNGMINGIIIEWYANGTKKSETPYVAGKKEGKASIWFENGSIQQESIYQRDKKNGITKEWYSNGSLKDSIYYSENNIVDGTLYTETGEIERERSYTNGTLIKERIILERIFKNGDYYETVQEIYKNGEEEVIGILKNGQKDGLWTVTGKTGQVISEELYYDGNRLIRDIDGNAYTAVQIGSQCWMDKNLRVTRFNNGESLLLNNQPNSYSREPAYCWYEHNNYNGTVYGALYNWSAIKMGNLCPNGWHIPSYDDWWKLYNFLGGPIEAGPKLKARGKWNQDNSDFKNRGYVEDKNIGFNALPGGYRSKGYFYEKSKCTYFWAAEKEGDVYVTASITGQPKPNWSEAMISRISTDFDPCFFYVRCVQD